MKMISNLGVLIAIGLVTVSVQAQTDTNSAPNTLPERSGQVVSPTSAKSVVGTAPATDARPDRPERLTLPQETKDLLYRFERVREAYLAERKQLLQEYSGATDDEDRERIRQLMRERRDAWLEQIRLLREESKERINQLRNALPQHGEVLDSAREQAREKLDAVRERRGTD